MDSPDLQTKKQSEPEVEHAFLQDQYEDLSSHSESDRRQYWVVLPPDNADILVWLAGAATVLGLFAINRYARCPVRRRYGRLGLGVALSTVAYRRVMREEHFRVLREQYQDPDLRLLWVAWEGHTQNEEVIKSFNEDHYRYLLDQIYDKLRYTEEDKRRIREDRLRDLYISSHARAMAHLLQRAVLERDGVSPHDIHHCTSFFASPIEGDLIDRYARRSLIGGIIAGLAGILVPWRAAIPPLFFLYTGGLLSFSYFGSWRVDSMMYHIGSLQDKSLVMQAIRETPILMDPEFKESVHRVVAASEASETDDDPVAKILLGARNLP